MKRSNTYIRLKSLTEMVVMHVPDGFLEVPMAAITYIVILAYGGYVLRRVKPALTPERVSLFSVLAALV